MYWVRVEILVCSFWVISKASCNQKLKNSKIEATPLHSMHAPCYASFSICIASLDERKVWFLDDSIVKGGEEMVKMLTEEMIKIWKGEIFGENEKWWS